MARSFSKIYADPDLDSRIYLKILYHCEIGPNNDIKLPHNCVIMGGNIIGHSERGSAISDCLVNDVFHNAFSDFLCQVLCEYAARGGDGKAHLSDEQLLAKFQKKITSNPKVKVHKEKVKLVKGK